MLQNQDDIEQTSDYFEVVLLCEEDPWIVKSDLFQVLQRKCPDLEMVNDPNILGFTHSRHVVHHTNDVVIPTMLHILPGSKGDDSKLIQASLQHSKFFPEAKEVIQSAPFRISITSINPGIPYKEHLEIFLNALEGILEYIPCKAMHWVQSWNIISPEVFMNDRKDKSRPLVLFGALNFRFFITPSVTGKKEYLVDTLGLYSFGLPDLQCHFHSLDVREVGNHLIHIALYIYKNGNVIQEGHTVQGLDPQDKWLCRAEHAMAEPKRHVIDLDPGSKFAGGVRY